MFWLKEYIKQTQTKIVFDTQPSDKTVLVSKKHSFQSNEVW